MQDQATPLHAAPRVDIGALAAGFQREAATRLAATLVCAADALDENERPLNELQKIELTEAALRHFDGFERTLADELERTLHRDGVTTWGRNDGAPPSS